MKQIYSKNEIFYHDYIKIKKYNDSCYKLIQFKHPVRQSGFEEIKDHEINLPEIERPTDYTNDEYLRQSLSRTKRTVHEYALCNEFEYFVTLTFDRNKIDSSDIKEIKRQVGQWLSNYKKRYNPNLKYLLIFELHKDKKHFHIHGLMSGIDNIIEFKKSKNGVMRYNWTSWQNKFGFTSLEKVDNNEAISRYITKYITKDLVVQFNKQRFIASKGLKKPTTLFEKDNYYGTIPYDYENEHVRIKNISSYDELMEVLNYISNTIQPGKEVYYDIERSNQEV